MMPFPPAATARLCRFLRDERGAVTVDFTVFWGGVVMMGATIVGDVSTGTIAVSQGINQALDDIAVAYLLIRDEAEEIAFASDAPVATVGGGTGNTAEPAPSSGSDPAPAPATTGPGNPGNDKPVGHAGETPNGEDGWGSGAKGQSE